MLRLADAGDWQAVYRLVCLLEDTRFPAARFEKIFREQVESPFYFCYLWEENGTVVGMLNLRFEEQLHHCDMVAEILEFVIDPALRGGGIGHRMIQAALELCREKGCCLVELSCNRARVDAHRFYERERFLNTHCRFTMDI